MKRLFRIVLVIFVVIFVVVAGLTIFIKSFLTSENLKAIIIPKLESVTGRQVSIDNIDASLFKGITVKGVVIKEEDAARDFLTMKELVLSYRLPPLLRKQIVIDHLKLDSPSIHLLRLDEGSYNFSSILKGREKRKEKPKESRIPFSLQADKVEIRDAFIQFEDAKKKIPPFSAEFPEGKLKVSPRAKGGGFSFAGDISMSRFAIPLHRVQTATSGTIKFNDDTLKLDMKTTIGKDVIETSGEVDNYLSAPRARMEFHARHLNLDALAAAGESRKTKTFSRTTSVSEVHDNQSRPYGMVLVAEVKRPKMEAKGRIKVDEAVYQGFLIKDFSMPYRYSGGMVSIEPRFNFSGGGKMRAQGSMSGGFLFRFLPNLPAAEAIRKTLTGKGEIDMKNLEIRKSKITESIAIFTGIEALRAPVFESAKFNFSAGGRKVLLSGIANSPHMRLNPAGAVGFDKKLDLKSDLKISPLLAQRLSGRLRYAGLLRDERGWTNIPLKITGSTEKPSVGLNTTGLGRQLRKGVEGEIKKRLFEFLDK